MIPSHKKEYALYRGNELLCIGTVRQIAKERNVQPATIKYYLTKAYMRKWKNKDSDKRLVLVPLDD